MDYWILDFEFCIFPNFKDSFWFEHGSLGSTEDEETGKESMRNWTTGADLTKDKFHL